MQAKRAFGLVSAGILIALTACSSDDDQGEAISNFTKDFCDLHEGFCCTQQGKTYDSNSCILLLSLAASNTFDKGAADACIAGLRAAQNSPTFCTDKGGAEVNKKCDAVYPNTGGAVPPGGNCKDDRDCAAVTNAEVVCAFGGTAEATTQTCQAQVRGTAGADCQGQKVSNSSFGAITSTTSKDPTITICWEEDNLSCDSTTKKCTPPAELGAACSRSSYLACAKDAYCARKDQASSDYVCKPRGQADQDCDPYDVSSCVTGFHCEQASKKCTADVPLGGACDSNVASQCGPSAECTNGTCKAATSGFSLFCK